MARIRSKKYTGVYLNQLINSVENSTTVQIAIVVIQSIGQDVPKDFATRLFQEWGIGQNEKDNGLLILTVIDQRRTEMETGYGLEGILPDAICYRIASQEFVPYFKEGEYGKGLIAGVRRVKQIVENPKAISEVYDDNGVFYSQPDDSPLFYIFLSYLVMVIIFLYRFVGKVSQISKGKTDLYDKYISLKTMKHRFYSVFLPFPFIFIYYLYTKPKLSKYRDSKRFSKVNGKELFRMNEKVDDVFLVKGQIMEEEIDSVDYDVWLTQEFDDILILKYDNRSKYTKCSKCGYLTYYIDNSEVIKVATTSSQGIRMLTYKCKNCGYSRKMKILIAKKSSSSSSYSGGSSSSSGSGGSSSFGGGSSGGGGAGVSW